MLTEKAIIAAKPKEKDYRLSDSGGLHLFVSKAGSKLWRYRYEIDGREKLLSLGQYPEMKLAQARDTRDEARRILRDGRDPSVEKRLRHEAARADRAATFETVARDWHAQNAAGWAERHAWDVMNSLERDVFPKIGSVPIRDLKAPIVLGLLRDIEARGAIETAHRIRQRMSAVFVHSISSGIGEADPAAIVKPALRSITKGQQPAVTDLEEARAMLRATEAMPAHPVTKLAMRFLALTAVRPGVVGATPWEGELEELGGDEPLWRIPGDRMKAGREHLVPLSRQAVDLLEVLRRVSGRGPLAFPNARWAHKPMSENALGYLLNRAGYASRHCPHGWRATFSTVMNERHRADRDIIDIMLAHVPKDRVEAAYNRSQLMKLRRQIAQEWADLILADFPPAAELLKGPRRGS